MRGRCIAEGGGKGFIKALWRDTVAWCRATQTWCSSGRRKRTNPVKSPFGVHVFQVGIVSDIIKTPDILDLSISDVFCHYYVHECLVPTV